MTPPIQPEIVFALPNKFGGVLSIVADLLTHRKRDDGCRYGVLLTDNVHDLDSRFDGRFDADWQREFQHRLPLENLRAVTRRVAKQIGAGEGALVTNDWLEVATAVDRDLGRAVIQIVHGDYDYYYNLAADHERGIDAFVAYSKEVYRKLCERLPHRQSSIYHLPIGVLPPEHPRTPKEGPLRLCFLGRLVEGKGICDMPLIDAGLVARGVEAKWTLIGEGPDRGKIAEWAKSPRVSLPGQVSKDRVIELCREQDVFVLPTRAEGFPVSLLESMAVGLVPVVSDLPTGVPEVVGPQTGFRPGIGDVQGFIEAIAELDRDRGRLEAMSRDARRTILGRFDVRERAADYQQLFAQWRTLRRPRPKTLPLPTGSRLDKAWMPNAVTIGVRTLIRSLRKRRRA